MIMNDTERADNTDKCLGCGHCVKGEDGVLLCDALAPILYAIIDTPEQREYMARVCEDFEERGDE